MKSGTAKKIIYISALYIILVSCSHLKEARTSYNDGNFTKTIELCLRAVNADTLDIEAYTLLSKTYRAADSLSRAFRTIRLAGKRGLTGKSIDTESGNISLAFARQAVKNKDGLRALQYFRTALEKLPADIAIIKQMYKLNLEYGRLGKAGDNIS